MFKISWLFKLLIEFCVWFQLFFQNNQGGEETTVVNYIGFIGSPLDTTNMEDFKRVIWNITIEIVRLTEKVKLSKFLPILAS